MSRHTLAAIVGLVIVGILWASTYTVPQTHTALKFRFGEVVEAGIEPGLHFKLPFIENVRYFDMRIRSLDQEPERYLTSEKKDVIIDYYVKWQIKDPIQYYIATRGDSAIARNRLNLIVMDELRAAVASHTLEELIAGQRGEIMQRLSDDLDVMSHELGIAVVDLRIKRIDLPPEVSESVFRRMRTARAEVANRYRAEGREQAERIRAEAERKRTIILAEAYREAQQIRGEGDAQATEIYADAYTRAPEFYSFTRSLEAYRNSFSDKSDVFVLQPDSQFFDYFSQDNADPDRSQ